jgi:hydroxymethylpyrimidine pyrophosphatase-like HAD family hydrolase
LELTRNSSNLRDHGVLILSAGGRNPDVLTALRQSILDEVSWITVVCGARPSPLGRLAHRGEFVSLAEFSPPSGKDGFLATNSIAAFTVLLHRAFNEPQRTLPSSFEELTGSGSVDEFLEARAVGDLPGLLRCETLIVLYGAETKAPALDLESKCTEAALAHVQLADFRNFAHGRHNWLAKRSAGCGVLAYCGANERGIASRTLSLLPDEIPKVIVHLPGSGAAIAVSGFLHVLAFVGRLGKARRVDPGRPGVSEFGRQLYRLREGEGVGRKQPLAKEVAAAAVRRKIVACGLSTPTGDQEKFWRNALRQALHSFMAATFNAAIFDYDGTLCTTAERFTGPSPAIGSRLASLLNAGIPIGIATGRGNSVRSDLRRLIQHRFWQQIVIGYFNGAEIGALDDDSHPTDNEQVCPALQHVAKALASNAYIRSNCTVKKRPLQISILPNTRDSAATLWAITAECLGLCGANGIRVVTSAHSVDIIAPGVSKLNLVRSLQYDSHSAILCVGDRGRWPGNDYELLQHRYALSVDRVSPDPVSGWNFAPPGYRGTQATIFYLDCIHPDSSRFQLTLPRLKEQ